MPAASEPGTGEALPALPRTWRPIGPRIVSLVLVIGLAAVCAVAWTSFDQETRDAFTPFQLGTLAFLALLVLIAVNAMTRSRVTATREGLTVVNGYRRRSYEWAEIVAVSMPPGAPWATLDLADGSTVSALGIQGSDGATARQAVRQLRALAAELG